VGHLFLKHGVVFVFSFPRYLQRAQEIGELFKKRKAKTIGISDSVLSPLKAVSNQLLVIPQHYTSFSDPCCAFLLLMQAIIMEYISKKKKSIWNEHQGRCFSFQGTTKRGIYA